MHGSWQDLNWHDASRGPSAIAELLVYICTAFHISIKGVGRNSVFDILVDHSKSQLADYKSSLKRCDRVVWLILEFYAPEISLKWLKLHTHPFNGPLFGTTWVRGKTNLNFTEAKRLWVAVASSGPYATAPHSRQITTPAPHHSVFLQAGCPSCRPTNSVKALKAKASDFKFCTQIDPVKYGPSDD